MCVNLITVPKYMNQKLTEIKKIVKSTVGDKTSIFW